MDLVAYIEDTWTRQAEEFVSSAAFRALEDGTASPEDYDRFIANVFRTHQNSPQFFGFLLSVAAPSSRENVAHNLLEELGVEEEDGESHPDLLLSLIDGAGLADRIDSLRSDAQAGLKETVCAPFALGSLRQMGLSAMVEVFAYEHMLAHQSGRIARFLREHRGLPDGALIWFTHHSEVDIRHAQEALETLRDYLSYYSFSDDEARAIIDGTLAENTFVKRYFAS
ncbi:MAG: hypothetical protein CL928_07970 [Deltaproteobacteria bacterium]|nr:hypothetical protein [Deltaproteobacteria bacterium]